MSAGGWVLMIIAWVALIAIIVWAISRLIPGRAPDADSQGRVESAREVLDRRLASGEIDTEEYARRREALGATQGPKGVAS